MNPLHPTPTTSTRHRDWIATWSGGRFWPTDPRSEDVNPRDIAHALSMTCRFAGHCQRFYSVAEHSVLISRWLEDRGKDQVIQRAGLLCDAAKAYLSDVPDPIKPQLRGFSLFEKCVLAAVFGALDVPIAWATDMPEPIRETNARILVDEAHALMLGGEDWPELRNIEPLLVKIEGWRPELARDKFLSRYSEVSGS